MNYCLWCERSFFEDGEFCTTFCENAYWARPTAAEDFEAATAGRITAEQVHQLLKKAVDLKGEEYVYPTHSDGGLGCYYARDGQPDCIVGHVLADLGVPIAEMSYDEEPGAVSSGTIGTHRLHLHEVHGLRFENTAWGMLCTAQDRQDRRYTWGESLREAERVIGHQPQKSE